MSRAVDFLRSPAAPRAGWWLLALGVACVLTALGLQQRWSASRAAQLVAAQQALRPVPLAKPVPRVPDPRAAMQRHLQAQPELQRPWLPTWQAVEAKTGSPVYLLAMSFDPARGLVKLDAEAPNFDLAMAYVESLPDGRRLGPALMTSHQPVGGDGADPGAVRFSVLTNWVQP